MIQLGNCPIFAVMSYLYTHIQSLNSAQMTPMKLKSTLIEQVFIFLSLSYARYESPKTSILTDQSRK